MTSPTVRGRRRCGARILIVAEHDVPSTRQPQVDPSLQPERGRIIDGAIRCFQGLAPAARGERDSTGTSCS